MFAAFAYTGARARQADECDAHCDSGNSKRRASLPALQPTARAPVPLPAAQRQAVEPLPPQQAFGDRAGWAEAIYGRFIASGLLSGTLDAQRPTVPVILHPSASRGGAPPLVTARHLGFLRVDLTGEGVGPGRFFPLFPEDDAEAQIGVDTGSLDRFGCTGHWASSGCVRLLAVGGGGGGSGQPDGSQGASGSGASGSDGGGGGQPGGEPSGDTGPDGQPCASRRGGGQESSDGGGGLSLMPPEEFAALWEPSAEAPGGWHVPYPNLLPLEEAYGGLYRELKALGCDLSRAHYMLRGWKTKEGRQRLGGSAPRAPPAGSSGRAARGVVPQDIVATRHLRAMIFWPGLLQLLEEEGVEAVPTDGVRYWLARLGRDFQRQLAAAGVLAEDTTVHHIVARATRGIDHPLNFFIIDRGANSAMGSRVEGFRDAQGRKLHMRDVVGEEAFEVAAAACDLYHGMLYSGRQRGEPINQTLRSLRKAAFAVAAETIEKRRRRAERKAGGYAEAVAAGQGAGCGAQMPAAAASGELAAAAAAARMEPEAEAAAAGQGGRSGLKRAHAEQPPGLWLPAASTPAKRPAPEQQRQSPPLGGSTPLPASGAAEEEEAGAEAGVAALSLQATPLQGIPQNVLADSPASAAATALAAKAAGDLGGLRARLLAALQK